MSREKTRVTYITRGENGGGRYLVTVPAVMVAHKWSMPGGDGVLPEGECCCRRCEKCLPVTGTTSGCAWSFATVHGDRRRLRAEAAAGEFVGRRRPLPSRSVRPAAYLDSATAGGILGRLPVVPRARPVVSDPFHCRKRRRPPGRDMPTGPHTGTDRCVRDGNPHAHRTTRSTRRLQ